jgi:hypothetical protein
MGVLDVLDKLGSVVGATMAVMGFGLDRREARSKDRAVRQKETPAERGPAPRILIGLGLVLFAGCVVIVGARWLAGPDAGTAGGAVASGAPTTGPTVGSAPTTSPTDASAPPAGPSDGSAPAAGAGSVLQAGDVQAFMVPPLVPQTDFDPLTLKLNAGALVFGCWERGPDGDLAQPCERDVPPVFDLKPNQDGVQIATVPAGVTATGAEICATVTYGEAAIVLRAGVAYCAQGPGWVAVLRVTDLSDERDTVPEVQFHATVWSR